MPIMMFSISAPLPAVELTSFEQNVQKRVESVNGVGEVILFGARAGKSRSSSIPIVSTPTAGDLGRGGGAAGAEPRVAGRPQACANSRSARSAG